MFKKAFMKKVAQISQKYKPVFFEPEKIEDLMQRMEDHKRALEQDRESMNMTRAQYGLFRKIYLEMRKESDEVVDG